MTFLMALLALVAFLLAFLGLVTFLVKGSASVRRPWTLPPDPPLPTHRHHPLSSLPYRYEEPTETQRRKAYQATKRKHTKRRRGKA